MTRGSTRQRKRLFFAGSLSPINPITPGIWFNEGNGGYYIIHVSLETRDLNVLPFYYFLFFSSELKTNVRGRMAMARGRDHFSVGLRKKKQREKEREKVKRRRKSTKHLSRYIKTTIARESRVNFIILGRTLFIRRIIRYFILTLLRL